MRYLVATLAVALGIGALALAQAPTPPSPAPPLKVCLISASDEYQSTETLAEFQKHLESKYNAVCTRAFGKEKDADLPGLETLDSSDVAVVYTRRITLPESQLARMKKFALAGKPLVGLRTASHAFNNWPEFDKDILGGNYKNHYGKGPKTEIAIAPKGKDHPILAGFRPYASESSLYRNTGLAEDCEVLLTGAIPEHTEPLAWTRVQHGGRVFYTSLGAPEDFANEGFRQMLVNAIFWVSKRGVEAK